MKRFLSILLFAPLAMGQPTVRALYITYGFESGMATMNWNIPTHIIYSWILNDATAPAITLSPNGPGGNHTDMVGLAHSHGKKCLISWQDNNPADWTSYWYTNTSPNFYRNQIIHAIADYIYTWGYDGFDFDTEYGIAQAGDGALMNTFLLQLRDTLNARGGNKLITCYVGIDNRDPGIWKTMTDDGAVDWVMMQSYDLAGPGWTWNTWHCSPLYSGGLKQPGGATNPCIDDYVQMYRAAGFNMSKLVIGASAASSEWFGGSGLCVLNTNGTQSGTCPGGATLNHEGASGASWGGGSAPSNFANDVYQEWKPLYAGTEQHDTTCVSAYVSIDQTGSANDKFISFDDGWVLGKKWQYCAAQGLGGQFIWDYGGSYYGGQWQFDAAWWAGIDGPFPLKFSANNRYFVDQNNTPFLLIGDAPWDMPAALTLTDAMRYIKNLDSTGFTFIEWRLLTKGFTNNAPNNAYNVAPFTGAMYKTTPVEAYWAHIDSLIDSCAARNIIIWIFTTYLGYGGPGSTQGHYDEVNACTAAQMKSFGQWLGQRWANKLNIMWAIGGDCDPTALKPKLDSMMVGILQYSNRPRAPRNEENTLASTHWSISDTLSLTFNGVYQYTPADIVPVVADAYNFLPTMPFIMQETGYENEHSLTRTEVTQESWYSILGGCTAGMFYGNCPIWYFGQTAGVCGTGVAWIPHLYDPARLSMKYLSTILRARHWYNLIPDTSNAVADSGYGSAATYCTTAKSSDSTTIITYMPTRHQLRVKFGFVKGDSVALKWTDPANGTETSMGRIARATTTVIPPTGNHDWVLTADSYTAPSALPKVLYYRNP